MADLIDPSEIMFTPFEPKTKNRYIMYIEGIPAYLIKTANRPSINFETKISYLILSNSSKLIKTYLIKSRLLVVQQEVSWCGACRNKVYLL
mgnify:CR=1 FL=1